MPNPYRIIYTDEDAGFRLVQPMQGREGYDVEVSLTHFFDADGPGGWIPAMCWPDGLPASRVEIMNIALSWAANLAGSKFP